MEADATYSYSFGKPLSPGDMRSLLGMYSRGGVETDLNAFQLNDLAYNATLTDLMNLYMSVFRWDGLPEGVSSRQLEYWLMTGGLVAFTRDEEIREAQPDLAPEGYAVVRCYLTGQIDLYDLPDQRRVYSMVSAVNGMRLDPDTSVLVWDSLLRVSPLPMLTYYARRLTNIDRSIDVNVANQKTTKVIRCSRKQLLSLQNAMNQQQGNQVIRWEDSSMGDVASEPVAYDAVAPYVASDLQLLKRQLKSEVLTFCGVDNSYGDKRERMITGEVEQGAGDTNAHKISRQEARQVACDQINGMFGLEVSCDVAADVRAFETALATADAENGIEGDGDGNE